jgi:hypothetical protein
VLPEKADELNSSKVPTTMVSVFVTEREGLAWIPRSQPEMKEPAMARTSGGARGMSNDCGMAEPLSKMFSMVW